MTRNSIGYGFRGDIWLESQIHLDSLDEGRVWFYLYEQSVVAVVGMRLDGTVLGLELHVMGSDAAYPPVGVDDREYLPRTGPVLDVSIGTRTMRGVPWGELIAEARALLRYRAQQRYDNERARADAVRAARGGEDIAARVHSRVAARQGQALRAALREPGRRPGRRGYADEHYADLALKYASWLASDESFSTFAKREGYSESGLRAAIKTARRRHLLTDTERGVAGGEATERARELVRRMHEEAQRGVS